MISEPKARVKNEEQSTITTQQARTIEVVVLQIIHRRIRAAQQTVSDTPDRQSRAPGW
jgi:hypothetical protein